MQRKSKDKVSLSLAIKVGLYFRNNAFRCYNSERGKKIEFIAPMFS